MKICMIDLKCFNITIMLHASDCMASTTQFGQNELDVHFPIHMFINFQSKKFIIWFFVK
jgi:hypothetical protein